MQKIEKIRQQISKIIDKEMHKTQKEIEEYEQKKSDNEAYYGLGGWYTCYQKAIDRREKHLVDLEALKKAQGEVVILEDVKFYAYFCPRCLVKIHLKDGHGEKIDCPICSRPIYRSSAYEEMKIQRGSRHAVLNDGSFVQLDKNGMVIE